MIVETSAGRLTSPLPTFIRGRPTSFTSWRCLKDLSYVHLKAAITNGHFGATTMVLQRDLTFNIF